MFGVVAGYLALFMWLALRRYEACLTQSGDTTLFECAFYNTLKGNLFWAFSTAGSYFESHPEPLLFLYIPLYALAPSPEMSIFLQTLCIAVSAIPVFLVGRKLLRNDAGAICMAVAFLFFPSIIALTIGQVHTISFGLPFLMFSFYFFYEENFWPYVITLALVSLSKESFPLTAAMFAPYALWKRRRWHWVATSLVVPIGLLLFDLMIVRPHFAKGSQEYFALQYFPGMGNSLGDFAKTLLTRPDLVAQRLFTARNALYLAMLLGAVAFFLPFLSKEAIFLVPELFLNLLSSNDGMKVVIYLYNCEVGAFLVIASLFTIVKLERRLRAMLGNGQYGVVLAGCVAILCLSNWWQWFNPSDYQYDTLYETRQRAFTMIPPDDSLVAGPGQVLAHLAHRKLLADPKMIAMFPDQMFNYNWVFYDMNYQRPILGEYVPREQLMAYGTNTDYQVVFAENNIFVLRRKVPVPLDQVTPIRHINDELLLQKMRTQSR
ncbi:MAG TPA: DUF2079 domain-containing protein [Verrucomicrobiae bacterium]|nr:DUF2079 domain-containing protein [Verrucomicrobiae bacterium]